MLERVSRSQKLRFFTAKEAPLIEAIFEHILPQSDRSEQYRIPIVPAVDDRLYNNRIDGYRYESMPPDQEAYRLGMQAIEEIAKLKDGRGFLELTPLEQDKMLKTLHDGKPEGAHEIWKHMPVDRFWMLLVQDAAEAYYSHPYAWDEIGFGGPAYPRAYMRLENGEPEPWEVTSSAMLGRRRRIRSPMFEWIGGHDKHLDPRSGRHALKVAAVGEMCERTQRRRHMLGPMQKIDVPMRRFGEDEEVDYVIVGVGSAGGVLAAAPIARRFSRAGLRSGTVLGYRARLGQRRSGLAQSLLGTICASPAANIRWRWARTTAAKASAEVPCIGRPSRRAFIPRIFASTREDGVGMDWPITYEELKPYYELMELEMPVAGPAYYPWGDPHGYPYGPHPMGGVGDALIKGCTSLGIGVSTADRWRFCPVPAPIARTASIAASAFRAARSARRPAR